MKIIYIGNFKEHWTTETHVRASFEALGHKVIPIQEDTVKDETLLRTIDESKPDFLLYTKTWNRIYDWNTIRAKVFTVSWCLDLYVGLEREKELDTNPFFQNHLVITPDGGHQDDFMKHGVNHAFVKAGVYDKECYMADEKTPEYEKDIMFVGSYQYYHPEWPHRKALVDFLIKTYRDRFDYQPKEGCVRGHELNKLYASAKVVVGDSLYSPYYWSDRIYETLGRGGFLIHPKIEGLEDEFEYGKHIVGYNYWDFAGLKKKIDYYLEHEDERLKVQKAGHLKVKKDCTYLERCKQVINIIKDEKAKSWVR